MDATWEMLQRWIAESHMTMNDLYVQEAPRDEAALARMAAKADAVIQLVGRCRQEAA